jgi:hypothetical protein
MRVSLSIPKRDPVCALGKLSQAVEEIGSTDSGNLRARLCEAAVYIRSIRPDEIPDEELRRVLVGVKDDLRFAEPSGDEGRLIASFRITNDEDASAIARRIYDLHRDLDRLLCDEPA